MDHHFPINVHAAGTAAGESSSAVEAYINGVCAGLSFRSLLNSDPPTEARNALQMPKTEPLFFDALPYNFSGTTLPPPPPPPPQPSSLPSLLLLELPQDSKMLNQSGKQRRRRQQQRLSDKTRCLQKLLPWDEKMDMATVLEEAYKYIRFLQAQISVLQSMPSDGGNSGGSSNSGGELARLNRQQLLQVVVNSPVAQTQLYSKGCCIYSVEQLLLLKRNALYEQQMLLDPSNPNPFF